MRGRVSLCAASVLGALLATVPVAAHPLGNFSVNRYAAIGVEPEGVEIRYLVDMAEIPTFQEMQESGLAAQPDHPGTTAYLVRQAEALGRGLRLHVDGRPLGLRVQSRQVSFTPGAADLPTMKLTIVYRAAIAPAAAHRLSYRDENFADRLGWREVVARAAPGVVLAASSVPERDRSRQLSDYPADLLDSPPQVAGADIVVERAPNAAAASVDATPHLAGAPGEPPRPAEVGASPRAEPSAAAPGVRPARADAAPAAIVALRPAPEPEPPASAGAPAGDAAAAPGAAPESGRRGASRSALTDLMTRQDMGFGMLLFTLATAMVLGAFHALEPGHGKTVVGAYLVGSRGTVWHAVLLGLAVTISHTAGVFLLGAVTLYASRYVMPEHLYPWLGAVSGLAIAGVGLVLLRQRWRGETHRHDHGHAHRHAHRVGHHHGGRHHHHHAPGGPVSVRSLFALGLSGGIVPCPGALVVLLSALAWRRVGLGILLVVAFSVGLAAVLVAIGVLMVHARRLFRRLRGDGALTTRWLPLASSAVITALGVLIAVQALAGAGIIGLRPG